ncbi:MAG TPA: hypothetical protein VIJ59_07145 [Caulobacteraceae bacterium]
MDRNERDQVIQNHLAWCQAERDWAARMLVRLLAGWRFEEGHGGAPLADVTNDRAVRWRKTVAEMDAFIAAHEPGDDSA